MEVSDQRSHSEPISARLPTPEPTPEERLAALQRDAASFVASGNLLEACISYEKALFLCAGKSNTWQSERILHILCTIFIHTCLFLY